MVSISFQGVNRMSVLSFQNEEDRTGHGAYYLFMVEIKEFEAKING